MTEPTTFLRLDATPPQKSPPPADAVDVFYDPAAEVLKVQKPDGTTEEIGGSVDNAAVNAAISSNPELTRLAANAVGYDPSGTVIVDPSGTDSDRGLALVAAYSLAKLLTPNGSPLSATNRATVVIPPGGYSLASTFTLDRDFVDLAALVPTSGQPAPAVDYDITGVAPDYAPPITHIYSSGNFTAVEQDCLDIRMSGFGISIVKRDAGNAVHGFAIKKATGTNSNSVYVNMYFGNCVDNSPFAVSSAYTNGNCAVVAKNNLSGTWMNCIGGVGAWRCSGTFSAKMYDCTGSVHSFVGDTSSQGFVGARLERCRASGNISGSTYAFAGCTNVAAPVDATTVMIDCVSDGDFSFALSNVCAGKFYRCRSGNFSFASGIANDLGGGNFSGYAEECIAGANSFGGGTYAKLTGTLVRCTIEGNTVSTQCEGATLRSSRVSASTTGVHAITLLDSNSTISNSDILVLQGGTGIPIYAATAKNVAAYGCRMNNASNDADGLGSNVTNLVSSAGNIVSNSVK